MINLRRLGKSFNFAVRGIVHVFKNEQNFRVEVLFALLVIALIFYLRIEPTQAAVLVLVITFVLILELFNTITERMIDILKPRLHHYVEVIKNVMAAAVFLSALASIIIGLLIIGPYILEIWLSLQ